MAKGGGEYIRFDLEKYQGFYVKEVHTYSVDEFIRYLKNEI